MNSAPRTVTGMAMLTLRIGLGALFLYTGIAKIMSPTVFLMDIRSFHILPDPYAAWAAMGLPWLEVLAGTALVSGVLVEGGLSCITAMLAVFLWAIVWSWQRGLDISCGCFGETSGGTDYPELIVRDTVLFALALTLLIHRGCTRRRRLV